MNDCDCCGIPIMGDVRCAECSRAHADGNECDPAITWHCFVNYCDGSGCRYAGECLDRED